MLRYVYSTGVFNEFYNFGRICLEQTNKWRFHSIFIFVFMVDDATRRWRRLCNFLDSRQKHFILLNGVPSLTTSIAQCLTDGFGRNHFLANVLREVESSWFAPRWTSNRLSSNGSKFCFMRLTLIESHKLAWSQWVGQLVRKRLLNDQLMRSE